MRTVTFAVVACLLAGCANPQSTAPAVASNNAKPACDNALPETGSHFVDRHNCDHHNVSVMGGDAVGDVMRQSTPGTIQSH